MREQMCKRGQPILTANVEAWRIGFGTKHLVFFSGDCALLFITIYKSGLQLAASVTNTLLTMVHRKDNLVIPMESVPLPGTPWRTEQLCEFEAWKPFPVPRKYFLKQKIERIALRDCHSPELFYLYCVCVISYIFAIACAVQWFSCVR